MEYLLTFSAAGARTYFLQNILHNWADAVCLRILKQLKGAMIPGYSKLLIGNIILPDENVPLRASGLDIAMLFMHSGAQRSEVEWHALLQEAGFQVTKVWLPEGDGDGIICGFWKLCAGYVAGLRTDWVAAG